jgi:hypothetical protein
VKNMMKGLLRKLERIEERCLPARRRRTPWDVMIAAQQGEALDPTDPDVIAATEWWADLLAKVPDEVPDVIEAKIEKARAQALVQDPGTHGPMNGSNGQRAHHGVQSGDARGPGGARP